MRLPANEISERGRHAAIGHVLHVDAGHHLEQLARHMGPGSAASRGHVDLARISFGVGDELGNGLGRNRWIHHHDTGLAADARDRRDVAKEIVIELIVERRVDYVWCTDEEERVAVGGRAHDGFGGDIAGGARPVLDDEWLAEPLRQPLADQAREDVIRATGGKADDQAHRPRRIGLRPSDARYGRQRGSARGQMQKIVGGEVSSRPLSAALLDHLVGAADQRQRNGEAERLGSLQVDDQLDFGGLLDRQIGRLLAFENLAGVATGQTVRFRNIT